MWNVAERWFGFFVRTINNGDFITKGVWWLARVEEVRFGVFFVNGSFKSRGLESSQSESSSSSPWSDLKMKDGTTKFATKYIEINATLTRRKVVISPDSDGGTTLAFGFNLSPIFG